MARRIGFSNELPEKIPDNKDGNIQQVQMFQNDILDLAIMNLFVKGITSSTMISNYLTVEVQKILPEGADVSTYQRSPDAIRKRIASIRKSWATDNAETRAVLRRVEVEKLKHVEAEAWKSWDESKEPGLKEIIASDPSKSRTEYTHTTGNPRYLEIIRRVIDQRSKMLGLQASDEREERRDNVKGDLDEILRRKLATIDSSKRRDSVKDVAEVDS